ncbi:hypothetical protein HK096_000359, partial [Nowakowskiella sp. JEL0078]
METFIDANQSIMKIKEKSLKMNEHLVALEFRLRNQPVQWNVQIYVNHSATTLSPGSQTSQQEILNKRNILVGATTTTEDVSKILFNLELIEISDWESYGLWKTTEKRDDDGMMHLIELGPLRSSEYPFTLTDRISTFYFRKQ